MSCKNVVNTWRRNQRFNGPGGHPCHEISQFGGQVLNHFWAPKWCILSLLVRQLVAQKRPRQKNFKKKSSSVNDSQQRTKRPSKTDANGDFFSLKSVVNSWRFFFKIFLNSGKIFSHLFMECERSWWWTVQRNAPKTSQQADQGWGVFSWSALYLLLDRQVLTTIRHDKKNTIFLPICENLNFSLALRFLDLRIWDSIVAIAK